MTRSTSDPTEEDREHAERVTMAWETGGQGYTDLDDRIANALVEERERVLTHFLAVADELHRRGMAEVVAMDSGPGIYLENQHDGRAAAYARAEHLIREAAKEIR